MASLIVLPQSGDAFSQYRPSRNAHTDLIDLHTSRDRKQGESSSLKTVRLSFQATPSSSTTQDKLKELCNAIPQILQGKSTDRSLHFLSDTCHRLVLSSQDNGQDIYRHVKEELDKSVGLLAREWRAGIMGKEGGWVRRLVDGWKLWEAKVNLLSAVLVYLDRIYASSLKIVTIYELAVQSFRAGIWSNEILASKRKEELLAWADQERSTGQPDALARSTITALTQLAKLLDTFHTISEPYLESTGWHYTEISQTNIDAVEQGTMSPTRYVEWVQQKVEEEEARARECFDVQVAISAVDIVRTEAGTKKNAQVVRKALDEAMEDSDQAALGRLYRLVVDCHIFASFVDALRDHIKTRLTKVIGDPANDANMIESTLVLKRFADGAIKSLFEKGDIDMDNAGDSAVDDKAAIVGFENGSLERARQIELDDAIRVGFKAGMGSRQNAPAEWIAKHLDVVMRKGQGSGTEVEFNNQLDQIIALIGFTKDKDVFKAFYSTQLAKRLLLNKSASDDMERNMILKLQNEMGEEFTSGDVMMKDLALSETLVKSYQQAQSKNPEAFCDPGNFTANVLTESAWPAYPLLKDGWNFQLTPELQTSIDQFTKWYSTQHKNRQLSWRWQLATVSLTARFPSGRYEIGVSLFQAVALLQFNEEDSMTFTELQTRTGIERSELVRTVQSLSMGRKGTRVMVKKPAGKEVNPDDVIGWNKAFSSDRIKFKINQIQQDMSAEESRKTNEQVAIDRVSVLEATIVRIMKGKKKMTLQLLIDAVVTDVSKRFPPDVKEIKKRMESLIEREFLMRDEDDRNLLHYLA